MINRGVHGTTWLRLVYMGPMNRAVHVTTTSVCQTKCPREVPRKIDKSACGVGCKYVKLYRFRIYGSTC